VVVSLRSALVVIDQRAHVVIVDRRNAADGCHHVVDDPDDDQQHDQRSETMTTMVTSERDQRAIIRMVTEGGRSQRTVVIGTAAKAGTPALRIGSLLENIWNQVRALVRPE
jgi:hypothetical protein